MLCAKVFLFLVCTAAAAGIDWPSDAEIIQKRELYPRDGYPLLARELVGEELALEQKDSNFLKDRMELEKNLTKRELERRQGPNFSYIAGPLVIAGYLRNYAATSVDGLVNTCRSNQGYNGTETCAGSIMRAAADGAIVAVLGYASYAYRAVDLVQAFTNLQNLYQVGAVKETEEGEAVEPSDSQPCPNHNVYAKNFGGYHGSFGGEHGFKVSCKRSCGKPPLGAGNPLQSILHSSMINMLSKKYLNMEFTVYIKSNGHVLSRCQLQIESVQTNTCVVGITGSTCQF